MDAQKIQMRHFTGFAEVSDEAWQAGVADFLRRQA
jgi:hypothetical protein